jgi:HlyD family secretion protein
VIQHPDGGVVAAIAVDEGQTVTDGDILLQLDPLVTRSDLTVVEGHLLELIARRGRLKAERYGTATILFDPPLITTRAENANVYELM